MGDTSISWTDKTWNCIRGCTRVSPGCQHCYAERQANRFRGPGKPYEGLVTTRLKVISDDEQYLEPRWTGEVRFIADELVHPLFWKKPARVFVNSMSDLFHEKLSNEQIAAIFGVMASAAGRHTFQVLTKRAKRMREWFEWIDEESRTCNAGVGMTKPWRCLVEAQRMAPVHHQGYLNRQSEIPSAQWTWPLPNVWIGVSVEDQQRADERIPELLRTPAAVRFLSCEPLLGPVDLTRVAPDSVFHCDAIGGTTRYPIVTPWKKLDWIIVGCESGPRARHCDVRWIRLLRDQCMATGTKFFLKQASLWNLAGQDGSVTQGEGSKLKQGGVIERPYLDGRQHLAFPA